jgi:hypothetical protein
MSPPAKPLPVADPDTAPYWEGANAHELRAQQCAHCGRFRWPPSGVCPSCQSWQSRWVKLPGTGVVNSFVVVHQPFGAFASEIPYAMARIALDDTDGRVVVSSNVTDCPWQDIRVGMRVTVFFDDVTENVTLPKFRPLA